MATMTDDAPRVSAGRYPEALVQLMAEREAAGDPISTEELVRWDDVNGRTLFEWDDAEASHQYRLMQARRLLNHISAQVNGFRVRAWANLEDEDTPGGRTYYPMRRVSETPSMRQELIAQVTRRLETQAALLSFLKLSTRQRRTILDRVDRVMRGTHGNE